jgi:hypothetical protein
MYAFNNIDTARAQLKGALASRVSGESAYGIGRGLPVGVGGEQRIEDGQTLSASGSDDEDEFGRRHGVMLEQVDKSQGNNGEEDEVRLRFYTPQNSWKPEMEPRSCLGDRCGVGDNSRAVVSGTSVELTHLVEARPVPELGKNIKII